MSDVKGVRMNPQTLFNKIQKIREKEKEAETTKAKQELRDLKSNLKKLIDDYVRNPQDYVLVPGNLHKRIDASI